MDLSLEECGLRRCDEAAMEMLHHLCRGASAEAAVTLAGWLDNVEDRATRAGAVTTLEYLVVLALLREQALEIESPLVADRDRCAVLLCRMRWLLTGERIDARAIVSTRLPRVFLAKQPHDVQVLHTALFRRQDDNVLSALMNLYVEYVPRAHDALIVCALAAAAASDTGFQLVAGAAFGYIIGTFTEHCLHKCLGHASKPRQAQLARSLARFGGIGRRLYEYVVAVSFSHGVVHHASFAANYVQRFAPRDGSAPDAAQRCRARKERIDRIVREQAAGEADAIVASGYGTSLAHPLQDVAVLAPISALLIAASSVVINALGGYVSLAFGAAALSISLGFLALSHYLHPYLHMRRREALQQAGALMKWVLNSRYVSHIAQAHYLHHQDVAINQNLAPGADFFLAYKMASVRSILALRSLGAFY